MKLLHLNARYKGAAVLVPLALVLAACGGTSDDPPDGKGGGKQEQLATSLVKGGDEGECTADKAGGAITITEQVEYSSIDPVAPSNYANPMYAIYGALMRYNPAQGAYEPDLAASLEPKGDSTVWTLTLKDGITFGDGSPMTAGDVIASIERFRAKGALSTYTSRARYIDKMTAVDDKTVEFTLTKAWTEFPYLLATPVGEIVNPRVPADALADNPAPGAGAGAFVFDRWTPGNELVVKKKDDWWGGAVCLDSLRFITQNDANARKDTFDTGEAQVFNNNANLEVSAAVVAKPDVNYVKWPLRLGFTPNFGVGPEAKDAPLANNDVRQGLQMTLDPQFMVDRVNQGAAEPSDALMSSDNPLNRGLKGVPHDKDAGKQLLDKAKQEGWDGKITIMSLNQPGNLVIANNAAALWKSVGVDVTVKAVEISQLIPAIQGGGGFDLQVSGASVAPIGECVSCDLDAYRSDGSANRVGFSDATIDQLAEQADALPADGRAQLLQDYQEAWNNAIPRVLYGQQYYLEAWTSKLQGVRPSRYLMVDFSKAWLKK
ncbi:ABC transporter substrate-binding protein [Micromonospora sp. NPDC005206]|uniref:ABC transporter substrate-binding protein n=1 Tax=Micromonospora sp. NPDC005206 TaxID=3157022 RepID=UPI0033A0BF61